MWEYAYVWQRQQHAMQHAAEASWLLILMCWCVLTTAAGLDFPYVKHPFQPNTGRKKMADL